MNDELIESGIAWIGNHPNNWKVDRIKDKVLSVVGGEWGDDPESDSEGQEIVILRVANIIGINFDYGELTVRKVKESKIPARLINPNTLLIEKSGGGEKQLVGRVACAEGLPAQAICSNFMGKIDFHDTVDVRFVNYVFARLYNCRLNFPYVQQTTGIQNLNTTYYLTTPVAFPPKPEQEAIARHLDTVTARIDEAIAIKQQQVAKLEAYWSTRLHEAVTKGLNETVALKPGNDSYLGAVPVNWKVDRIKDIAKFNPWKPKIQGNEAVSLVPMDCVSEDGQVGELSNITFEEVDKGLNYFEAGDVIFAKITPCMENGKGAFVKSLPTQYAFGSTEFFVFRPYGGMLGSYLYYATRTVSAIRRVEYERRGWSTTGTL